MESLAIFAPVSAIIALIVAFVLASWIGKKSEGTDRMKEIAGYIREGAMAFLRREYRTMVIVIIVLAVILSTIDACKAVAQFMEAYRKDHQ